MLAAGRQIGRRSWMSAAGALGAGIALGWSFVDFELWWLPWFAVAPLIAIAETHPPRQALRLGWLGGAAGIACAFIWLVYAAWGAGPFSVDGWLARRKSTA